MSTPVPASSVSSSPLLALPAELRNMIYDYALGGNRYIIYAATGKLDSRRDKEDLLALLRTNRQVYSETRLMPYSNNGFAFGTTKSIHSFANARSIEQAAAVRTVALQTFSRKNMINERKALKAQDLVCLSRLPGLRKIEIWDYCYLAPLEMTWIGGIWLWTGGRSVIVNVCRWQSDLLGFRSVETLERPRVLTVLSSG